MDFKHSQKQFGEALQLHYVAPRKRKPKRLTFAAKTIEEACNRANNWLREYGGKFVGGYITTCDLWTSQYKDEEPVHMYSVSYDLPSIELLDSHLKQINNTK